MTDKDSKSKTKLRGQENYIEWSKRFELKARLNEWGTFSNGQFTVNGDMDDEVMKWITDNISDEAINALDPSLEVEENLALLNRAYGYGRLRPIAQEKKILDLVEFPVNKDPNQGFLWLDKQFNILKLCAGTLDERFLRRVMETGLECSQNPNSFYDVGDFWAKVRGELNQLATFELESVKTQIWDHRECFRNKRVDYDKEPFNPIKKTAPKAFNIGKNSKCEYCSKFRQRIAGGHTTDTCYFGDSPG
jgi:hypothetical protein